MPKLRVGLLFGGRSTEHEVSVTSATNVLRALDPARYEAVLIGIDHDGHWYLAEAERGLSPESVFSSANATEVAPTLTAGLSLLRSNGAGSPLRAPLDVVFPITHGRYGEDGTLQGLLELAGVAYVGAGVLASAVCMDKVATKRLLRDAGIPVVDWLDTTSHELQRDPGAFVDAVSDRFGFPCFAKPVNTGSSVGIHKAHSREELSRALADAARYDLRVMVERAIDAREVECSVLGGYRPEVSCVGEIIPSNEFYDYEAKYVSEDTRLVIPAQIPERSAEQIRTYAARAFQVTDCWCMARVDFFLAKKSGEIYLNELNTLPGMTEGSLYWRAWEASGIALPELCHRLIELALERHRERRALELRYRRV
jgi:D-alanine-D-alanine ligase